MAKNFDFRMVHGWGGAYAVPLSDRAREYIANSEDVSGDGPFIVDFEGDLCCDHKDALDMAQMLRDAGFTFRGMEALA